MICHMKKVALILVLSFLTAQASDHHSHDANHQDSQGHSDSLTASDHWFHEYHHHHPVEQPNCGQICPKNLPRFQHFEVGNVYTVDLDGQTLINVREGQTVSLKTKVDVHVLSPCEFSLTLRDTQLTGVPNPQELGQQLDASPALRFGAHDGKILGVCPAPEEAAWTLNIKKAALSAMQLTTKDLAANTQVEEVDFSGHCTTNYRPLSDTSDTKNLILEKTKNLNRCHLRRKNIAGFQSKSLGLLTEFMRENVPILMSNQRCVQEIKSGHLFSVQCTEEQRVAFQADTLVVSTMSLKFGGKTAKDVGAPTPPPPTAQTLLMTRDNEDEKTSTEADIKKVLTEMCAQVSGDKLAPEVTQSFQKLVRGLRTLPEAETRAVDTAVKSLCPSPKLRQLFLAASAFAASDPSIQTLIDAFEAKELSEEQIAISLGLVALKTRPSEKTIDNLNKLVSKEKSERSLMLGVSIMVRNFCKRSENCLEVPEVKKTLDTLVNKLKTSTNDQERIVAIKAIENIRAKTDATVKTTLLELAQKSDADVGVRLAAIQALKKLADDDVRQKLIDIFTTHSEPTEVRVMAYKTVVMSGANAAQLAAINSGADPQIKNYVQSHIRNLKKSSSPNRRALLPADAPDFGDPAGITLGVTRNIDADYRGATIESDVVYPKGSFIPSLMTMSVHFPVGDKDYQIAEIQIRQAGLSQHIQKLFSRGLGGTLAQLSEGLVELMTFMKDSNHKHSITLQASVRLAGSNLMFVDTLEDLHRVVQMIRDRMKELYDSDKVDLARGIALLDQEAEAPQILGFSMIVSLSGNIVATMEAEHSTTESGAAKIRNVRSKRSYTEDISAGLVLKVRNYRPGFQYRLRAEMHPTSDAQLEKIENRIMKVKVNLPQDKKSLFKVSQTVKLIDGNGVAKESNEIGDDNNEKCRQMMGLNLCRTASYVAGSPIPNVEYFVTKQDPTVNSIEWTFEKPPTSATRDLLVWSAKAAAGPREYVAQLEVRNPAEGPKKASVKLVSPKRTITADLNLLKSTDGNVSKLEFDLKLPNVVDINTKYDYEVKGEEKVLGMSSAYKLAGSDKTETMKWDVKSSFNMKREKKTKIINVNYYGDFQSSQFPMFNSRLSYYTNLKPYQDSKSDVKFEWGPELKQRARVQHTSKMDIIELRPFQAVSENTFVVEVTPLDINYQMQFKTDIKMLKSKPKHISFEMSGNDVENRPNRAVRGAFVYDRTDAPVLQTINITGAYPGREMSYFSEIKQTKDWSFEGKTIVSPQAGKVVTIEHKISSTKPTEEFHANVEADVSYSDRPDKVKVKTSVGWVTPDKFEYKHNLVRDGQKYSEWDISCDKKTYGCNGKMTGRDRAADFKIDNVIDPRSAQWGLKYGPKSLKFSALRVPRESYSVKLDSSENSRLKEFKLKVSRKEKSMMRLLFVDGQDQLEVNSYMDHLSKEKKGHLDFKCTKHQIEYVGDLVLNRADRKITFDAKTDLGGKPFMTLESQASPKDRTFLIMKIMRGEKTSKMEYFYDKGTYGAVIDTSKYSAVLEGQWKNGKNFGNIGFVDKINNYDHKSRFNVSDGLIVVKSISDEQTAVTKLDAVIGPRVVSNITLVTPKVNAKVVVNPFGEKKTLVAKWNSPSYEHDSNVEWVPLKYLKADSMSLKKTEPQKKYKMETYLSLKDNSKFHVVAPSLDIDIQRVKGPKTRYIFNSTINGYNEVQEFDSNPSLTPIQNLFVALKKYIESYTSDN